MKVYTSSVSLTREFHSSPLQCRQFSFFLRSFYLAEKSQRRCPNKTITAGFRLFSASIKSRRHLQKPAEISCHQSFRFSGTDNHNPQQRRQQPSGLCRHVFCTWPRALKLSRDHNLRSPCVKLFIIFIPIPR